MLVLRWQPSLCVSSCIGQLSLAIPAGLSTASGNEFGGLTPARFIDVRGEILLLLVICGVLLHHVIINVHMFYNFRHAKIICTCDT